MHFSRFVFVVMLLFGECFFAAKLPHQCKTPSKEDMIKFMGAAFHSRYMSVDKPEDYEPPEEGFLSDGGHQPSFSIQDPTFESPIENNKNVRHINSPPPMRRKKRESEHQWQCNSTLVWTHLGEDHFPRYLRSVQCACTSCWFGHYKCKPKSFTLPLLRRKRDVKCDNKKIFSLDSEWEFVERAVTFCCECVPD